jgi:pyrroline-5-carboxylate reductase
LAKPKQKILGFIGGGNMATALVKGLIAAGRRPNTIIVAEPLAAKRSSLKRRFAVKTTASNLEAAHAADVIVIAVKPQVIGSVLQELREALTKNHVFVSIAAGVRIARMQAVLGPSARIVRAMPNTPCLVSRGTTVLCAGRLARRADVSAARDIFRSVGQVHVIDDEACMDAVTGLSGSGPAYVYRFAEALIVAGTKCGLSPSLASALTYQTIAGGAEMLLQTGETPEALRATVSSPGGTTLAGLSAMEESGFFSSVCAGVEAAVLRSRELAGEDDKK